ncbi:BolA family transcriptional regulator [Pigmentiphaga sp.]|uniref:BolA family protein n=1 Tax=Pigmentiphaga sp. TaxID=1977564 RepID=UPI0025ED4971|nr:BolA family protein [Pigmentiphaga sp.]MBX6319157.1 BolA family transcriptional regulator [Pigmentiphaga sp.]
MSQARIDLIRERLQALAPAELDIRDESHLHAGHAGAAAGGGHFRLRIVSSRFAGLNRLARHRLVYDRLADLMPSQIHALAIQALTPEEDSAPTP